MCKTKSAHFSLLKGYIKKDNRKLMKWPLFGHKIQNKKYQNDQSLTAGHAFVSWLRLGLRTNLESWWQLLSWDIFGFLLTQKITELYAFKNCQIFFLRKKGQKRKINITLHNSHREQISDILYTILIDNIYHILSTQLAWRTDFRYLLHNSHGE